MQIPQFWHGCVVFFFVFLARVVRFSTISFCASRQCFSCLFPGYLVGEAAAEIGFFVGVLMSTHLLLNWAKFERKQGTYQGFGISELGFFVLFLLWWCVFSSFTIDRFGVAD
jgi:hypothetical protein